MTEVRLSADDSKSSVVATQLSLGLEEENEQTTVLG